MSNVIDFPTQESTIQCLCGNWTWIAVLTPIPGGDAGICLVCPMCKTTHPVSEDDEEE